MNFLGENSGNERCSIKDLNEELTASSMNAPYNSPHAFGKTYGEHRILRTK